MNFAEPRFFYCLIPLLLLGIILYILNKRHKAAVGRLGTPDLISRLSATVNWRGRRWQTSLWFLALFFLIVTLARPQWGNQVEYIERRGVEIMIALDVSESMLAEDFRPNRLAR